MKSRASVCVCVCVSWITSFAVVVTTKEQKNEFLKAIWVLVSVHQIRFCNMQVIPTAFFKHTKIMFFLFIIVWWWTSCGKMPQFRMTDSEPNTIPLCENVVADSQLCLLFHSLIEQVSHDIHLAHPISCTQHLKLCTEFLLMFSNESKVNTFICTWFSDCD